MDSIALKSIRTDGNTQMRAAIDSNVLLDYRDKWRAGVKFNPVDVFYDGSQYWLADGFHRFYGAREAKRKDIPAKIHNGTVRDAKLFACGANTCHGLARSNADKRIAVETLLNDEDWCKWSDRKIADVAGVSNVFVGTVRDELLTVNNSKAPDEVRTGRDGKKYPKRKKPRPAKQAEPESADDDEEYVDPEQQESEPYRQLKHWWGKADETARCLFRLYIDDKL